MKKMPNGQFRKKLSTVNCHLIRSPEGFSLVELLVMITILVLTTGFILILIDPVESAKRNRDTRRLLDFQLLSQAIEDYYEDNSLTYPDPGAKTTVRKSNLLPMGNSGPVAFKDGNGWLDADFSDRLEKLPVDPLNTGCNVYRYAVSSDGLRFKVDTIMEHYTEKMTEDGGQDSTRYESGNATSGNPINMGSCT